MININTYYLFKYDKYSLDSCHLSNNFKIVKIFKPTRQST